MNNRTQWNVSGVILYRSTFENLKLISSDEEFRKTVNALFEYGLDGKDLSDELSIEGKMAFNSTKGAIYKNVSNILSKKRK